MKEELCLDEVFSQKNQKLYLDGEMVKKKI